MGLLTALFFYFPPLICKEKCGHFLTTFHLGLSSLSVLNQLKWRHNLGLGGVFCWLEFVIHHSEHLVFSDHTTICQPSWYHKCSFPIFYILRVLVIQGLEIIMFYEYVLICCYPCPRPLFLIPALFLFCRYNA